jgi:hypothetical protein
MNLIKTLIVLAIFTSCSGNKETKATIKNDQKTSTPIEKNGISSDKGDPADTAAIFAKYPFLRQRQPDSPFDSLPLQRKVQLLEARDFFSKGNFQIGSFGFQFISYLRENKGKTFDKNFNCNTLKFSKNNELLETNSDEMKEIYMATYSSVNLYFKVNVNSKDAETRKVRLENVKNAFNKAGVDLNKLVFDDTLAPVGPDGTLSLQIFQKLPKKK